ncbi:hypothetical protein [Roseiconus lacunae]|nr:hypothetical protein [Roseiconus lacunae]
MKYIKKSKSVMTAVAITARANVDTIRAMANDTTQTTRATSSIQSST